MRSKPLSSLITAILVFTCISQAQTAERYIVLESATAKAHILNVSDNEPTVADTAFRLSA
ncbi:MAG TPA: hypothetical protein VI685_21090 [Candidatus Angelobacter sp.]